MTATPKILIAQKIIPNAQTTEYTSPLAANGGKGTWIDKATATNYSGVAAVVSVNLVTLADTAGNQNLTVKTVSLAAGQTYTFPELVGKYLAPGDFISWLAGTAAAINGAINGRELT